MMMTDTSWVVLCGSPPCLCPSGLGGCFLPILETQQQSKHVYVSQLRPPDCEEVLPPTSERKVWKHTYHPVFFPQHLFLHLPWHISLSPTVSHIIQSLFLFLGVAHIGSNMGSLFSPFHSNSVLPGWVNHYVLGGEKRNPPRPVSQTVEQTILIS